MSARTVVLALLAVAGVSGAFIYGRRGGQETLPILGMVRQTEIRVAPEIGGRLASVAVAAGQHVKRGDVLAVIDNPDLTAALAETKAATASAAADRARTYSGTRPEQVSIAAEAVRTAQANLLLAQQQNDRAVTLNSKSFLSQQQLDESKASLAKAQADLDGKRAQYAAEQAGPTAEERRLADARVALAEAATASLEAQVAKTTLLAPADGTVGVRVAELGEIMAPGKAVLTLDVDDKRWFSFTMREDRLRGLTIGTTAPLTADDGRRLEARVVELRPLGEFATWRAARAVGDHDLNSFRVRFDPVEDVKGLEPGMTVWLTPR
ncbi:HlyD family secretion protein [Lichenifustis flavocetrariae]|uniref:Biotin/lipoyl-binding protein n=1 Tax=Lichenifustis flavocetrariae TaxID=2949735 RepID=A0AA41YZK3_9HYPH|nr:HlyD family secretion protein [Lichenifustis flavocetrariae]MCW6507735.1 biotin/lipoyl-binding protein [Lichenifustis flavocetrariae]